MVETISGGPVDRSLKDESRYIVLTMCNLHQNYSHKLCHSCTEFTNYTSLLIHSIFHATNF